MINDLGVGKNKIDWTLAHVTYPGLSSKDYQTNQKSTRQIRKAPSIFPRPFVHYYTGTIITYHFKRKILRQCAAMFWQKKILMLDLTNIITKERKVVFPAINLQW